MDYTLKVYLRWTDELSIFLSYSSIRKKSALSLCFHPQVWSLSEQGTLLDILEGVGAPVSLLAQAGTLVASASHQSSSFKVWDLGYTQKPRASTPFLDRTGLTAVSHNGSYIYFPKVGDKNKVTIWDLAEGL